MCGAMGTTNVIVLQTKGSVQLVLQFFALKTNVILSFIVKLVVVCKTSKFMIWRETFEQSCTKPKNK